MHIRAGSVVVSGEIPLLKVTGKVCRVRRGLYTVDVDNTITVPGKLDPVILTHRWAWLLLLRT
jgi:hypothetical protein